MYYLVRKGGLLTSPPGPQGGELAEYISFTGHVPFLWDRDYLLRHEVLREITLIDGSLVHGVICRKAGVRKWLPVLDDGRLREAGALERARRLLAEENERALIADTEVMKCAYRPGDDREGIVVDQTQFGSLVAQQLTSLGLLSPDFITERAAGRARFAFPMCLGSFLRDLERRLLSVGPHIDTKQLREALLLAADRSGLYRDVAALAGLKPFHESLLARVLRVLERPAARLDRLMGYKEPPPTGFPPPNAEARGRQPVASRATLPTVSNSAGGVGALEDRSAARPACSLGHRTLVFGCPGCIARARPLATQPTVHAEAPEALADINETVVDALLPKAAPIVPEEQTLRPPVSAYLRPAALESSFPGDSAFSKTVKSLLAGATQWIECSSEEYAAAEASKEEAIGLYKAGIVTFLGLPWHLIVGVARGLIYWVVIQNVSDNEPTATEVHRRTTDYFDSMYGRGSEVAKRLAPLVDAGWQVDTRVAQGRIWNCSDGGTVILALDCFNGGSLWVVNAHFTSGAVVQLIESMSPRDREEIVGAPGSRSASEPPGGIDVSFAGDSAFAKTARQIVETTGGWREFSADEYAALKASGAKQVSSDERTYIGDPNVANR